MVVRRALKNDAVVAGGGAIEVCVQRTGLLIGVHVHMLLICKTSILKKGTCKTNLFFVIITRWN